MVKVRDVKLYATDIKWDIEDEEIEQRAIEGNSTTMEIPLDLWTHLSTDDYSEEISEYISNESGYCHDGFVIECNMSVEEMYKAVEEIEDELVKEYREYGETNYAAELELKKEDLETAICLMEAEQQFKRSESCKEPDMDDK